MVHPTRSRSGICLFLMLALALTCVHWEQPDAALGQATVTAADTSIQQHADGSDYLDLSTLLLEPGVHVQIPEIAAERLMMPVEQITPPLASPVREQILDTLAQFLPCGNRFVDEIIVLRHPSPPPADPAALRDHFMAGVVAVRSADEGQWTHRRGAAVRLYLFLPADLLDGSGAEKPITSTNVIPYAGAPTPERLVDFLAWTLAHEVWHLLDIQARLDRIEDRGTTKFADFDRFLADPRRWEQTYAELSVANHLGWQDFGESYAMSDELARPFTMRAGHTAFQLSDGAFQIAYADDQYSFKRGLLREGYLPPALQSLSDLQPLLKSGDYPTLYALFNTEAERYAEYGAWYLYAQAMGEADRFRQLHPALSDWYAARWSQAGNRCQGDSLALMSRP